ncbi:MAG: ATP-binding cassette domain-containing protein, partial [Cyanobacteria bacterium J06639_14]
TRIPIISHLFQARKTLEAYLQERVPQTADLMHLGELLTRKPGQLSGGQRQRVALARAMVRSPQLFLMDEPLSNLDAKLRADMRAEIIELQRRLGGTFIYVTHDQSEAMTMSDRVVLMQEGCIQQIGAPSELYDNPANLFVAEFIGSPQINTLAVQSPTTGDLHGFGNHLRGVPEHIDGIAVPV